MKNIVTRRTFLGGSMAAVGTLAMARLRRVSGQTPAVLDAEERERVEAAIPTKAFATPKKHRRLLIFDLNVGYGGHRSIPTASYAFTRMGEKTGAFETVVSRDPSVFRPESLRQFDAVFFNNTVGNCFEDPDLRQSLIEFVYGGGGLMGVHGTSVAFTKWPGAIEDWPEFGIMLGARGANHRANDEHVFIKLDDPTHPVNQTFGGQDFDYRDEFFRVHEPYSRNRVRVLLSIDTEKTDLNQGPAYGKLERADNDYALAWVRQYGRGRIFYSVFAHHPSVFWDPKMLPFYLAAAQFALGDLPAPTTPSAKLTPAIRAQEKLGWRLGLAPSAATESTLFDTIDKAAELSLLYVGGCKRQIVGGDISKSFDEQLSDDEMRQIRLKLDAAGVRLLTYRIEQMPSDEAGCQRILQWGRNMGIEAVIVEQPVATRETVERLCQKYDIRLAVAGADEREIVDLRCERSEAQIEGHIKELHRLGIKPAMFCIDAAGERATITRCIEMFNKMTLQLAH